MACVQAWWKETKRNAHFAIQAHRTGENIFLRNFKCNYFIFLITCLVQDLPYGLAIHIE